MSRPVFDRQLNRRLERSIDNWCMNTDPSWNLLNQSGIKVLIDQQGVGGCTEFCVNGLMAGNRRTSRSGYDRKHKESSTQRAH